MPQQCVRKGCKALAILMPRRHDPVTLAWEKRGDETSVERWLSGALVATVVAAGVIMWQRAGVPARDAGVATVTAPPLAKPALRPAASASVPPQPNVLSALFTAQPGVPLSSQVVRLLASGDPRDAFTAYMLVWACATFNRPDRCR